MQAAKRGDQSLSRRPHGDRSSVAITVDSGQSPYMAELPRPTATRLPTPEATRAVSAGAERCSRDPERVLELAVPIAPRTCPRTVMRTCFDRYTERSANEGGGMNVEFLSTVAMIAPDPPASSKLYVDALGLALESQGGDYYHSERIAGCGRSASGRWLRSPRRALGRRNGRRSGRYHRSVSSSMSRTPQQWSGGTGARASRLQTAASAARGAVGSDRGQNAVTGGRDHRDLLRPRATRSD